jgi:F-type H+-transporting ATPase subunit a
MTFAAPFLFAQAAADQGLPAAPVKLFSIEGIEINNSMIAAGITSIVVVIVVQIAMRAPKLVPDGLQNLVEAIVEGLSNFIESITGRETMLRGFWYFGGLFVFVFAENLLALLPGVGTIGYGEGSGWNFKVTQPFLRGANANANLTAAYAAIFFVMWFYWCFRALGAGGVARDIFGSKVKFASAWLNLPFDVLFFIVGLIEVLTILFIRPIAFTFLATLFLIPAYMWEFVVAFIQAFVFFILTVVFTGILTNSGAHGGGDDHKESH